MAVKKNSKRQKIRKRSKTIKNSYDTEYKFSPFRFAFNVIKLVISFVIIICIAAAGLLTGTVLGFIKTTPHLDPTIFSNTPLNTYIYDSENNIIAELKKRENRVLIPYEEIPKNLINAFVAIEDERFWKHHGVDFKAFGRAIWININNAMKGNFNSFQGGSTITQQLVKNLTGNKDFTIKRKIQEQIQALQLESEGLSKEEILYYYLNNVPMGGNFYGIETSAKGYFDKDVRELSLAECASLAAITNHPVKYMPINKINIKKNLERKNLILEKMLQLGMITEKEYEQARKEHIKFVYNPQAGKVTKTSNQTYYVDEVVKNVIRDLSEKYGYTSKTAEDIVYNSGLTIYTPMEPKVETALKEVFTDKSFFTDKNPYTDELPQAAMVILDPYTGYVSGIYGGRGEKKGNVFDRATQGRRQPGSSIKPLVVYAPGIEEHSITAATVVDDIPQYMDNKNPEKIYPRNYETDKKTKQPISFGLTTVRDGLVHSRNVVAALVLRNFVGIDTGLKYLSEVGIDRRKERYISVAMGGFNRGVTPLEMAGAYTALANRGVYSKPIFYTKVVNSDGKVILENKPQSKIVYSEQTAYIMNNIMQEVVKRGTAWPYGIIKNKDGEVIPTAGKTGTTNNWIDKWFCGYSPYYIGVTWYGYDNNSGRGISMNYKGSKEHWMALRIWQAVMQKIHEDLNPKLFYDVVPPNIVKRKICIDSGKLATALCEHDPRGSRVREEIFIKGTEPKYNEVCDVHKTAFVCIDCKDDWGRPFLATPFCPIDSVKEIVYIHRPAEYKPKVPDERPPEDIKYEIVEGEYCTIHGPKESETTTGTAIESNEPEQILTIPTEP